MTWSKDKVYAELGAVTSYAADGGGTAAMEVDQVSKGKSKGKNGKGKSSPKGKGKDKVEGLIGAGPVIVVSQSLKAFQKLV